MIALIPNLKEIGVKASQKHSQKRQLDSPARIEIQSCVFSIAETKTMRIELDAREQNSQLKPKDSLFKGFPQKAWATERPAPFLSILLWEAAEGLKEAAEGRLL